MGIEDEVMRKGVRLHNGVMMVSYEIEAEILRSLGMSSPPANRNYQLYDTKADKDEWLVIIKLLKVSTSQAEINSIREVIAAVNKIENERKGTKYFTFEPPGKEASFSEISSDIDEILVKYKRLVNNNPGSVSWQRHKECLATFSSKIKSNEDYHKYLKFERYVPIYRHILQNKDGDIDTLEIDTIIAGEGYNPESAYSYAAAYCAQSHFAVSLYPKPISNTWTSPTSSPTYTHQPTTTPQPANTPKPSQKPAPQQRSAPEHGHETKTTDTNENGDSTVWKQKKKFNIRQKAVKNVFICILCIIIAIGITYWLTEYTASLDSGNPHCMAFMLYAFPVIIAIFGILCIGVPEWLIFMPTVLFVTTVVMFYALVIGAMIGGYAPSDEETTNSLVMSSWIVITIVLILGVVGMFHWAGIMGCVIMCIAGVIISLGVFHDFGDTIALMMATLAGILIPTSVLSSIMIGLGFELM